MRDPDRISHVLAKVEQLWRAYPDWRLGQLIANVASWSGTDAWDLEEDGLVDEIDRHLGQRAEVRG
jgi:hypothetical protein